MKGHGRIHKGLTLIEVIIILAVLVTLIALLVPSTVQQLTAGRRNSTLDEMEDIKAAMIGDPVLKTQGARSDFGYLGDMGNLPSSLDDLVIQGLQPAYVVNSALRIGAGWKGPYLTLKAGADANSHKQDAFGNDYMYDTSDYTNPQGQAVDGRLVTLGADGASGGTAGDEDVTLEMLKAETTATVNGYVFDSGGSPVSGAALDINYPVNGTLTSSTASTDGTGFYQFADIPFGKRSVTLAPRLSLVAGSASAFGGGNQHVRFSVENATSSAITVRSVSATYSVSAFYDQIRWQGGTEYNCPGSGPAGSSGATLTLGSDQTVAAGAGAAPTVVTVASSVTQVANITLQAGTQAQIDLRLFRVNASPCPSGSNVNMSGVTFTDVTLRNPSNQIVGQFSFTVP